MNEFEHTKKNQRCSTQQQAQKSRVRAAQNQIYKKLKQFEEEERQKRKQAQKRLNPGQEDSETEMSQEDPGVVDEESSTGTDEEEEEKDEDFVSKLEWNQRQQGTIQIDSQLQEQ